MNFRRKTQIFVGLGVAAAVAGQMAPAWAENDQVPVNPYMSSGSVSNAHDDSYMSNSVAHAGPRSGDLDVRQVYMGKPESPIGACMTTMFDSKGNMFAECAGPQRAWLVWMDPHTLATKAVYDLPNGPVPAVSYVYIDNQDRIVAATANRTVEVIEAVPGPQPGLRKVRDYDLSSVLAPTDKIVGVMPDWSGRIWFATMGKGNLAGTQVGSQDAVVGTIDPNSGAVQATTLQGEAVGNSLAADETQGVYLATDKAMYRFQADAAGAPSISWRQGYENVGVRKPGQQSTGTGTTPAVIGSGYVAITDNADPMNVMVYRRDTGAQVCKQPVFDAPSDLLPAGAPVRYASATENSLVSVDNGLIVENNYGTQLAVDGGSKDSRSGVARIDIAPDGSGCSVAWTNDASVPSVVSKHSYATGLLYTYTREGDPVGLGTWYFTAIDAATGKTVFKTKTGTGPGFDSTYSAMTIGPDGSAYVGTDTGLLGVFPR
ncbi:hypothetical protein ACFXHA_30430 [Nocardia sp. NPDC059240]|uniref:hypothetical protein n=1 Tax=Nocardia sp. NPDC059240 TaxID=3346786 RepID=UPI0036CA7B0B